jgi:DNA-binding NarL/FixJ family response regulator
VPARVLVVAASTAAQAELEAILAGRPAITVVGRSAPGAQLARAAADLRPDVIILDGDSVVSTTLARDTVVVVLLDDPATQSAGALRAGARAVLRRTASPAELVAAIEAAAAGLVVMDPSAVAISNARSESAGEPLTRREREILTLLADGLGNKTIAARLGISDHTVKAHVGAIFDKLHVGTRAEAVALGLRLGLIAL